MNGITVIKNVSEDEEHDNDVKKLEENYKNTHNEEEEEYSDTKPTIINGNFAYTYEENNFNNRTIKTIDINEDRVYNPFPFPSPYPPSPKNSEKSSSQSIFEMNSGSVNSTLISGSKDFNIDDQVNESSIDSLINPDKPKKSKKVIDEVIVNENTQVVQQEENVDILEKTEENKVETNKQPDEVINNVKVTDRVNVIHE